MTRARVAAVVLAWAGLAVVAGCGPGGPTMHPVSGRVEVTGGNVADLAGSTIDAVSETDPTVRASGEIQADGRFTLETLHAGVIRKGAQEGRYKVRIILPDDDPEPRKRAAKAAAPKFRQYDTSGLSIQVPTDGEVTLTVSARP